MAYRGAYLRRRNFLNGFSHEHWDPPVWVIYWWGYYPPYIWARLSLPFYVCKCKVVGRENIDKNTYIFVGKPSGASTFGAAALIPLTITSNADEKP